MPAIPRSLEPLLLAAGLAALVPALAASQGVRPHRKPGMWETTMVVNGRPMTTGFCTDESIEQRFSMMDPQRAGDCTNMTPQPIAGGFRMEGTCRNGGRTSHMVATVKGDLASAYTMDLVSDVDGKPQPPIHMDARWTGPCGDRKPGDMVMPGGMVVNVGALGAGRPSR